MNPLSVKPKNIMVFGDIMLDVKLIGSVNKMANEAPIPVLLYADKKTYVGGCGNVLMNLQSLGCEKLYIFSMIGQDPHGEELSKILSAYPEIEQHLYRDATYTTIVKTRGFANKKIIFRYDIERPYKVLEAHIQQLKQSVDSVIQTTHIDAIVFSDYNKGFLTKEICEYVISLANKHGVPTFVDPKVDYKRYLNCTLIKPNTKELGDVFGIQYRKSEIEAIHLAVKEKAQCLETLFTLSEEGMSLCTEDGTILYEKAEESEVNDVTGAGDVVLSVIAYYYGCLSKRELVQLATRMGTISVKYVGTYVLNKSDILSASRKVRTTKLITADQIQYLKNPIVFTNGCFDILHEGHTSLFTYCSSVKPVGGEVMVAINSDASIRRLKGVQRPINYERARVDLLNNIETIDWIIVFDEDTPYELLERLRPHTLVKGGDYTQDTIIGKEFCKNTFIFKYVDGKSTTNIIRQIKAAS